MEAAAHHEAAHAVVHARLVRKRQVGLVFIRRAPLLDSQDAHWGGGTEVADFEHYEKHLPRPVEEMRKVELDWLYEKGLLRKAAIAVAAGAWGHREIYRQAGQESPDPGRQWTESDDEWLACAREVNSSRRWGVPLDDVEDAAHQKVVEWWEEIAHFAQLLLKQPPSVSGDCRILSREWTSDYFYGDNSRYKPVDPAKLLAVLA
ncbi:hypothetical protein L6R53_15850 [Myxococcota bacterium]|nr:hypothetical protein [Myxococcota bacterium]